jgi:hypothetical protein
MRPTCDLHATLKPTSTPIQVVRLAVVSLKFRPVPMKAQKPATELVASTHFPHSFPTSQPQAPRPDAANRANSSSTHLKTVRRLWISEAVELKLASQLVDQGVFHSLHPPAGAGVPIIVAEEV